MTVPYWAAELAERFWQEVGKPEPFPRNLRGPISQALPVALVFLSRLHIADAVDWLQRNGIRQNLVGHDRKVRALLVARGGHGFIFLDGADDEAEQRFSLAHELAHFLRDYWRPRQRIAECVGVEALEVADGLRSPTAEERIHALLGRHQLDVYVHWLERDEGGSPATLMTLQAEDCADRLAFELLAPAELLSSAGDNLEARLVADFGFPPTKAREYAACLAPPTSPSPLLQSIRFAFLESENRYGQ